MFKTISSKTALLITLAVSLLALTALAVWAQAAQAQSSVVRVDSMRQMFGDHDDDDGDDDATAHLSYLEIDISVSGVNRLAPAAGDDSSYGKYPIKSVEDRADCNEDDFDDATVFSAAAVGADAFKIKSGVTGNYDDDADEIFTVIQAPNTHHERYLCVEISYLDDDEDVQVDYAASSTMLDLEAPIVEEVVVNDDARNQEYGLGDNIDIMVEFDARVQIRKISEDTGDALMRPFIEVPTLGNAELVSLGSGTVLTFRYTIEFGDEDNPLADPASFVITMGNDYRITDTAGNPIAEGDTATIEEEIDFRGGEIAVELGVRAMRMGDRLVVKATPDKYDKDDGTDDVLTVASAIAYSSEDAPDVRSNEDPCEDGVIADGGVIYDNAADKPANSDYYGTDLPDETDDEYYCFKVLDDVGRTVYTNVYRYATDNTAPRIGFAYANNILTITASDPESGIDESSLKWFWSEIAADNVNKSCNSRTGESEFNHDGEDGMIEITIKASYSGDKICVRVENGEGDQSIVEQPLSYVDPGTPDPGTPDPGTPDPGTPDPGTPDPGTPDPGTPDPGTTPGTGTVKVPKTWPGQAVWDSWTTEKVTMNPWGCLDTTKIRGDNGQCISGGTSLTDGDYVYVNSPADAGSSSTTTAPGPGTTTPPTTPDPGTTTPPTTPDPGTTTTPITPDPSTTPDPETVDAGTITLSYDYAESMTTVKVSVDEKLTNVRYVVQEESGQCTPEDVAAATPMDVADDTIEVTVEDATNSRYVCVFATSSELDEDDAPIVVYQAQPVGEDAISDGDDETPPPADDGGNGIWIIVGIVAVAIVGVVVVLVFLGKRNQ